jgi:nicotinamide-nucleotide amidase
MGESLQLDAVSLSQIEAFFTARGRTMSDLNRVQAMFPRSATPIPNIHGTAPGIHACIRLANRECDVFCIPGPPREMMPMFTSLVLPRLRPDPSRAIHTRVLHTFGIGESDLAQRLGPLMARDADPMVGTTASGGVVSIRIRCRGSHGDDRVVQALHRCEQACRVAGGDYIFGAGDDSLAAACVRLLQERGMKLSVIESCTGGGLGALITQVAGSSSVFVGGLLTYSNEAKHALAGVPEAIFATGAPGAVSGECAVAMARGTLERVGGDHALSITGIAGPGGGSKEKPVGTVWIGRASRDGSSDARRFFLSGDRQTIRDLAAKSALGMLRLKLIGIDMPLLRQTEQFKA